MKFKKKLLLAGLVLTMGIGTSGMAALVNANPY